MERRSGKLPCGHQFPFVCPQPDGSKILKCCSCNWSKLKATGEKIRKTDWSYEQFKERQRAEGEA
jgi:hypothetical protein